MIDLSGRGSLLRTWLPLALLALLIAILFPPCGAPRRGDAREAWEGLVLLVAVDPPPPVPLRLLATLPIRSPHGSPEQRLVVADAIESVWSELRSGESDWLAR